MSAADDIAEFAVNAMPDPRAMALARAFAVAHGRELAGGMCGYAVAPDTRTYRSACRDGLTPIDGGAWMVVATGAEVAHVVDGHFTDPAASDAARATRANARLGIAFVVVVFRDADGDDALQCVVATVHRPGSAS